MLDAMLGEYNSSMLRRDLPKPKGKVPDERETRLAGKSTFAWDLSGDARPSDPMRQGKQRDVQGTPGPLRPAEVLSRRAHQEARISQPKTLPRRAHGDVIGVEAANVQALLDVALSRWWAEGELPPCWLLRDALLVLEAGHHLAESQRTLLLRTALACGKGIVTALKHQSDDERTILLLHEALTAWTPPIQASFLMAAARAAAQPWYDGLTHSLVHTAETTPDPQRRVNAMDALRSMGRYPDLSADRNGALSAGVTRTWFRRGLLAALVITILSAFWQQQGLTAPADMAAVPAGAYWQRVEDAQGSITLVQTKFGGFNIDRYEVTNNDYRRCTSAGACPWPAGYGSATRPYYFTEPAFGDYPVIQVTLAHATDYCEWRGKRLPTAVEWQVAAGDGSGARALTFPWGETFAPQWANGAASELGDTIVVGGYRPAGDSWLGVADLAGNVAEWTATEGMEEGHYLVKGGSFRSDPQGLAVHHWEQLPAATAGDWLGFRCAASRPPGR